MMDARTQRTLLRVGTLLGAIVVCTLIVVFVPNLDARFMEAIYGLGITAALGLDQWIKNSGDNAPPTVAAVNATLQTALDSPMVSVPPPKVAVPDAPIVVTLPDAQAGVPPGG